MYNYTLTRLPYLPIFTLFFAAGLCTGGLIGLLLVLLAGDTLGILSGAFIALLGGLISGLTGVIFTAVFNILSPYTDGLPIGLESLTTKVGPPSDVSLDSTSVPAVDRSVGSA